MILQNSNGFEQTLKLKSVDRVKTFCNNVGKCEGQVDIVTINPTTQEQVVTNAKLLLHLFSLNLSDSVTIRCEKEEDAQRIKSFMRFA